MCASNTRETLPVTTKNPALGQRGTSSRWTTPEIAALAVSLLAAVLAGWSAYEARQANHTSSSALAEAQEANELSAEANNIAEESLRTASQLVTYEVVADEDWNVTLRHNGGVDLPIQEVWVTPHFADGGATGYIKGPERQILVPPPEPGVKPTTYRIAQIDEQICAQALGLSCDERPLRRIKLRYDVNGEPTSLYLNWPGSGT
jgi:hypothetical protein